MNLNDRFNIVELEKASMMEIFLHQFSVSVLCKEIANEMKLSDNNISICERSGLLHDVGKKDIPISILQKPEILNEEEKEIIKKHAQYGYDILIGTSQSRYAKYVLYHHESEDGEGYFKKKSCEIELPSKIILVSDVYCALTENRIYRKGLGIDEALSIMEKEKHRFNINVFNALIRLTEKSIKDII